MVSGVHPLVFSPWIEDKKGGASPSIVLPHPLYTSPAVHLAHWIAITMLAEELFQSKRNYREVTTSCNMGFWTGSWVGKNTLP